jgi:hypothetical protein
MKCAECNKHLRPDAEQHGMCFACRVRTVGFTYSGGGSYGRSRFNDMTIRERQADIIGDRILGVDVVPASDYGR